MVGNKFVCFLHGMANGGTLTWNYFTPMQEAILPTMIEHDGGPYPGNLNDKVLVTHRDGWQRAGQACGVVWRHTNNRSTDIVGFQVIKLGD